MMRILLTLTISFLLTASIVEVPSTSAVTFKVIVPTVVAEMVNTTLPAKLLFTLGGKRKRLVKKLGRNAVKKRNT